MKGSLHDSVLQTFVKVTVRSYISKSSFYCRLSSAAQTSELTFKVSGFSANGTMLGMVLSVNENFENIL